MTNLEGYLTKVIQTAVKEAIREEIEEIKEVIRSKNHTPVVNRATPKNRIVRPSELAKMLSVSTSTLYRMINDGKLPPKIKFSGRAVGWLESELEEWLESKRV